MSRELFHHKWLSVRQDDRSITYVQWGDGACCIALNEKGEALLITEYSAAFGGDVLVMPGGGVEPGENPLNTANRELQEEIGFKAGRLDFLSTIRPLSKYLHVVMHVYLARDLTPSRLQGGDETWEIIVQPVPLNDFEPLIQNGQLSDSTVIAGLYMARAFCRKKLTMRREVYRHKWMSIWESDDGSPFMTMTPSDGWGTMIIPVTDSGEILILREFSQAYAERVWFLPGGSVETGEDPAESANRELQEEAGYKAKRMDYLGEINPFQKYLRARICVYLGRDLVPSKLDSGEDADTTVERIRWSDVEPFIAAGKLRDSSVIAALYMARAFWRKKSATMLRKIDCVMLRVDDLESAAQYYADVFGLKRLWQDSTSIGMGMPETDAEIVLHTDDIPVSVHYLVDDVVAAVNDLRAKGCIVRQEPFDIVIGKCAVIEDPFGNVLAILDMTKGART